MPSLPEASLTRNCERPRENKAEGLRQRIDESLDTLAAAVDHVRASETFKTYLDVQARFHKYSWHNSMLILMQNPDASQVAGFRTWKQLGRFVRKGERGIAILAPCPVKRTVTDENGDEQEREWMFFKVVHVFDVSQTDGNALPTVEVPNVIQAADGLLERLERVAVKRAITINRVDLAAGHYGTSKGGIIDIASAYTTGQQAKTLAHELAHEALHKKDRKGLTRNQAELEAESVAYVVCTHFGLDVEVRTSTYITLWGGDSAALRHSLERIAETARAIIDEAEVQDTRQAA